MSTLSISDAYKNIYMLTPVIMRRRFYLSFFIIGIVGVFEVLSLSALFAFFSATESSASQSKILGGLLNWFNSIPSSNFLLILVIILFVVKSGITLIASRHAYRTAIGVSKYFQEQLFSQFIYTPFGSYSHNKSSDWVRNITIDCNTLEGRFFTPILVLLGEIIPALFICGILLIINATAFIYAFLMFCLLGIVLFFITNKKLIKLGKLQQKADGNIVQLVQQTFKGLPELTLYNLRKWASRKFESFTSVSKDAVSEALFISLLPRFVFEVAVYFSLGVAFLIYMLNDVPQRVIISELAVFAAAAIRLLPSVSKVVTHLQSLKHAKPAVSAVTKVLLMKRIDQFSSIKSLDKKIEFNNILLRDASFTYVDHYVFGPLNLDIFKGDSLAIVGASGSGKSTLINLILGLLQPTLGKIILNQVSLKDIETAWWSCIGYVPQEPFIFDDSAIANVMLGDESNENKDIERANELLSCIGLSEEIKNLSSFVGEGGSRLSGGQRQRLAIARALYKQPQVLVLDEATSAMDVTTQIKVLNLVSMYMEGKTILMVTHRKENLSYCNKIINMPSGKVEAIRRSHD